MANVVLSDDLLQLYCKFSKPLSFKNKLNFGQIETTVLTKLLHYMQPFCTNKAQLLRCKILPKDDPALYGQILSGIPCMKVIDIKDDRGRNVTSKDVTSSGGVVNIENDSQECNLQLTTLLWLLQQSKLKMLFTADLDTKFTDKYIVYNILKNQYSDFNYCRTFLSKSDRSDGIAHIKSMLQNVTKITIADPWFIDKASEESPNFQHNITFLKQILPSVNVKLEILVHGDKRDKIFQDNVSQAKQLITKEGFSDNTVKSIEKFHDRYIQTAVMKIHLSSGCYYMINTDKEITYMVEILEQQNDAK